MGTSPRRWPAGIATLTLTLCSWVVLVAAATSPLWPGPTWTWSWDDRARAVVAGGVGVTAAVAVSWICVRAWRGALGRPGRAVAVAFVLLAVTSVSALVVLRSGTLLPDIRVEIVDT